MNVYLEVFGLAVLIMPIFVYIKAIFVSKTTLYSQRKFQRKNILFVIAHPDDEAM